MDFLTVDGPGWPDPLAALGAVIAAVLLGLFIGIPALRIRGVQLAVVTLAAVVATEDLLMRNQPLMGVGAQTTNPTPDPVWFGQRVGALDENTYQTDYWHYTVFALIMVAFAGLLVVNLRRGVLGRRFLAIRSNERAAAAAGVDVPRTKMLGFGVSSLLAGMAGVLVAYKVPMITSEYFSPFPGLALLAFVYLGGITTVWGAIFGGMLVGGGLISEFGALHFEGITQAYINAVGAIGLVINAVVTNGEGISLMLTTRAKEFAGIMRGPAGDPVEFRDQPAMASGETT
jgi:branched-chain amino acid transport system permease protein